MESAYVAKSIRLFPTKTKYGNVKCLENSCKHTRLRGLGTTPLTGERAQAILRGRPRGRLGTGGSGKGCLRGRPRGRFGMDRSETAPVPHRLVRLGSTHGAGAIL